MPCNALPLAALALAVILAGCTNRLADLSVVSTRNIDPQASYELVQRGVEGDDIRKIIIFIPSGPSNLEEAIDSALEKAGADYLTNARIYAGGWYVPLIYGQAGFRVVGDAWKRVE